MFSKCNRLHKSNVFFHYTKNLLFFFTIIINLNPSLRIMAYCNENTVTISHLKRHKIKPY